MWRQAVIILVSANHNGIPTIKFKIFFLKTNLHYQNTIPLWAPLIYVQINPLLSIVLFAIMYTEQALRRDCNKTKKKEKRKIPSYLQIVTHLSVKHYKATNRISEVFIYRCNKYIHIQTDRRRMVRKDLKKKNRINLEIKTQNTQSVLPHSIDSRYSAFSLPVPYSMTRFSSHTRTYAHAHNDQYKKVYTM